MRIITLSVRQKIPLKNSFTIGAIEYTIEELSSTLEKESQVAIDWFKSSKMIVNPGKFQPITVKRKNKMKDSYPLSISQEVINSENCVKLLGVEIKYRSELLEYFTMTFPVNYLKDTHKEKVP